VIARARADGSSRPWHGHVPRGADRWRHAPGASTPAAEPLAGTWRTWALRSGDQFRPPPPPSFGSPRFAAAAREVVAFRHRLTYAQMRIAKFWEGGVGTPLPPGVWNEVALAYVRRDRLPTPQAARVFALMNVAMADTGVATWDAKYAYWTPRPVTAIRDLDLDRHWRPFLGTPPFPSYVSAHSSFSGAASEVLAALFRRDAAAFRAKAAEAGMSRLYGGIHYRFDHDAGLTLGRRIGRLVLDRARRSPTS
jgi:membrane-associated phospholipid phosphatase